MYILPKKVIKNVFLTNCQPAVGVIESSTSPFTGYEEMIGAWIFVFVLYLFDEKPEDRISKQYLPMEIIAIEKKSISKA